MFPTLKSKLQKYVKLKQDKSFESDLKLLEFEPVCYLLLKPGKDGLAFLTNGLG